MNRFIYKNTLWRSGVLLNLDGKHTLIRADYEDKIIAVSVRGSGGSRRAALAIVRSQLVSIHKTIPGLQVEEKVPHPEYPELILDFDELTEFEKQGVMRFPRKVRDKIVMCNVKELLAGIEGPKGADVFISYSHVDSKFSKKIVKDLKNAGINVWQDRISLSGGDLWPDEISQGISQNKIVVVILSTNSIISEIVKKEYTYAINSKRKIVPVLFEKCELPFLLTNIQYVDFTQKPYKQNLENLQNIILKNL